MTHPTAADPAAGTPAAPPRPDRVAPLREVLDQLSRLVQQLDPPRYNTKPVTTYGGSVGGHVRHCLDHVSALLCGTRGEPIDYEARQRGSDIETCPHAALEQLGRLDAALADLDPHANPPVTAVLMLSPHAPLLRTESTLDRELAFVLNHTIHHHAMIAGMAKALDVPVPDGFGMAPGTLQHQQNQNAAAPTPA